MNALAQYQTTIAAAIGRTLPPHSNVGASGMFRWNNEACPGSVLACLEYGPDYDSYASREGTAAHELSERILATGLSADYFVGHVINDITVCKEMAEHVQLYADTLRAIPCDERHIETRFHLPQIHAQFFGTSDAIQINYATRTLYVTDLKYGRVLVSAENNMQLMYYALAALELFNLWDKIDTVVLTAYQPRIYGRYEPFESWTTTPAALAVWATNTLQPSMELALTPMAPRKAGTHCKDCRAKVTCSTFLESAHAVNGYALPLDNTHLATVLDLSKPLKKLSEQAGELAGQRLQAGQKIPGYKPVRSYKQSKINNPVGCAAELLAAGVKDIYKTDQLKGITELKKDGRAVAIVSKYAEREPAGIKAAPLSSTQPAVAIPTQCFSNTGL